MSSLSSSSSKKNREGEEGTSISSSSSSFQFFFSDELIQEVLIKLDSKTLFRSKIVCKRWRFLISEKCFINRFLIRSKSQPPLISGFFYEDYVREEVNFIRRFNDIVDSNDVAIQSNLSFLQRDLYLVASHNGILLCAEKKHLHESWRAEQDVYFVVCNPFTTQRVDVPGNCLWFYYNKTTFLYCYTKEEQQIGNVLCNVIEGEEFYGKQIEYKIFCFEKTHYKVNLVEGFMYCSETGEWNECKISHSLGIFNVTDYYILFDGSVYLWDARSRRLCIYDLKEESISCVKLPTGPTSERTLLGVSAGSLYYAETNATNFRVWILVDGIEWSLKHSIGYRRMIDEFLVTSGIEYFFCPFAFHPLDPELVLVRFRRATAWTRAEVLNSSINLEESLYCMDTRSIKVVNEFYPRLDLIIPYSHPAWIPILRDT